MSATTVNVELLRDVLTHITEHPEEHEQEHWAVRRSCGTAMCVAGHAVVKVGRQLRWDDDDQTVTCSVVGTTASISSVATDVLRLQSHDANRLFWGGNSLDDLWRIAGEITDGAIVRPAAPAAAPTSPTK